MDLEHLLLFLYDTHVYCLWTGFPLYSFEYTGMSLKFISKSEKHLCYLYRMKPFCRRWEGQQCKVPTHHPMTSSEVVEVSPVKHPESLLSPVLSRCQVITTVHREEQTTETVTNIELSIWRFYPFVSSYLGVASWNTFMESLHFLHP